MKRLVFLRVGINIFIVIISKIFPQCVLFFTKAILCTSQDFAPTHKCLLVEVHFSKKYIWWHIKKVVGLFLGPFFISQKLMSPHSASLLPVSHIALCLHEIHQPHFLCSQAVHECTQLLLQVICPHSLLISLFSLIMMIKRQRVE